MSVTEIKSAIDDLPPDKPAKLAAYIAHHDKLKWDEELEEDFAPGGKHAPLLDCIDREIDAGRFASLD